MSNEENNQHIQRKVLLMDENQEKNELIPFDLQAGGRTPFASLSDHHILKPCYENELWFYQNMPEAIRSIAPVGCATIQEEDYTPLDSRCSKCVQQVLSNLVIPESMKESQLFKEKKLTNNYIIMNDISHGMNSPCVFDMKIGTRQHGEHAPPHKVESSMLKCLTTTSATLGMRLGGVKYYDTEGNQKIISKYEGRAMDKAGLTEAVHLFLKCCPQAVPEIKKRILEIKAVLEGFPGLRLYGASLLMAIDANPLSDSPSDLARVCIIDFGKATFPGFQQDNVHEGVDDGAILGLENLYQIIMDM